MAQIALGYLVKFSTPKAYHAMLDSLIIDIWAYYLMLWIRQLNPSSKSIFWCDAYLVVELAYAGMSVHQHPSQLYGLIIGPLALGSWVLGLVAISSVRDELVYHYNNREPYGLYLDDCMSFLFSYLYFQSKLYDIGRRKKQDRCEGRHIPMVY